MTARSAARNSDGWELSHWRTSNRVSVVAFLILPSFVLSFVVSDVCFRWRAGMAWHSPFMFALFALLLVTYYIWDTSNSQRARFRMQVDGTYKPRWTFPQLPWGTLKNPKYLSTKAGSKLLINGWWKYARKVSSCANRGKQKILFIVPMMGGGKRNANGRHFVLHCLCTPSSKRERATIRCIHP